MAALREDPILDILDTAQGRDFPPLLPQLTTFIAEESVKQPFQNKAKTFIFEEGGRKGYMVCKYVWNGTYIFAIREPGDMSDKPKNPVLNITHVAIQKDGGEKNVLDRVCRQVLEETPISGVRIESIMSPEWMDKFAQDWKTQNTDNKVLFKGGRVKKSKRKSYRSKKTIRITQR